MIRLSSLPTSYERLEYIENTSTAYIDCGLKPKHTFDYEVKTNIVTGDSILGCLFKDDQHDFRFFSLNPSTYFDVGYNRIAIGIKRETGAMIHVKFGNYFIESLVNKEKTTGAIFDENMNSAMITNMFIWARITSSGMGSVIAKGKIWLLNINDNGKPIRKFIPVKRKSDGVIGMYDLVGRKFYTSPNGVAFTGG
jgi:hypothetical protein